MSKATIPLSRKRGCFKDCCVPNTYLNRLFIYFIFATKLCANWKDTYNLSFTKLAGPLLSQLYHRNSSISSLCLNSHSLDVGCNVNHPFLYTCNQFYNKICALEILQNLLVFFATRSTSFL